MKRYVPRDDSAPSPWSTSPDYGTPRRRRWPILIILIASILLFIYGGLWLINSPLAQPDEPEVGSLTLSIPQISGGRWGGGGWGGLGGGLRVYAMPVHASKEQVHLALFAAPAAVRKQVDGVNTFKLNLDQEKEALIQQWRAEVLSPDDLERLGKLPLPDPPPPSTVPVYDPYQYYTAPPQPAATPTPPAARPSYGDKIEALLREPTSLTCRELVDRLLLYGDRYQVTAQRSDDPTYDETAHTVAVETTKRIGPLIVDYLSPMLSAGRSPSLDQEQGSSSATLTLTPGRYCIFVENRYGFRCLWLAEVEITAGQFQTLELAGDTIIYSDDQFQVLFPPPGAQVRPKVR